MVLVNQSYCTLLYFKLCVLWLCETPVKFAHHEIQLLFLPTTSFLYHLLFSTTALNHTSINHLSSTLLYYFQPSISCFYQSLECLIFQYLSQQPLMYKCFPSLLLSLKLKSISFVFSRRASHFLYIQIPSKFYFNNSFHGIPSSISYEHTSSLLFQSIDLLTSIVIVSYCCQLIQIATFTPCKSKPTVGKW